MQTAGLAHTTCTIIAPATGAGWPGMGRDTERCTGAGLRVEGVCLEGPCMDTACRGWRAAPPKVPSAGGTNGGGAGGGQSS